jgi:hemoglobin/transferrin/lactoferrin receptor protein
MFNGVLVATLAAQAHSQTDAVPNSSDDTLVTEEVTVIGTRTERSLSEIDATVNVINREEVDKRLYRDIQDLVRYEPGVSVAGTGNRFGLSGFTIRGIGGNRVLTLVDGIRVAEEFSFGPFLSAGRDFIDVDTLERVDIARGPISSLYGSDALGGVVAVTSRSPASYLEDGKSLHLEGKTGYSSEDDSRVYSVTSALGSETLSGLVTYTRREASETETQGSVGGTGLGREQADPLDSESDSINARLEWKPSVHHRFVLGYQLFESDVATNILSDTDIVTRGVLAESRRADDTREREQMSATWHYQNNDALVNSALVTVYRQTSDTRQLTLEDQRSLSSGLATRRNRFSVFEQTIDGIFAQAETTFDWGAVSHNLVYGFDYYRTENETLRMGGTVDAATGAAIREFMPLPTRDFPNTEVENTAFFIQNEMIFWDGRLRVTPGLRYDDYQADTTLDTIYVNGNPGVDAPSDFGDSDVTLKLGAVYKLTDDLSVWARYSEGFRAPPYDDVNVGFTNFLGGYKTIAAPNLESERSEGYELGLRFDNRYGSTQLAVFSTRYDNFIESLAIAPSLLPAGGIDPQDGLLTFQSINREEVVIEGIEWRGTLLLGELLPALADFRVEGALAYARGEDDNNVPVNAVEPLTSVVGLRWQPASASYGGELIWTWADQKDEEDIDDSGRLPSDSYHVVDLMGFWQMTDHLQVEAGIFNVTDETYIRWADTVGIGVDAPLRFSRPGRNVAVNVRLSL